MNYIAIARLEEADSGNPGASTFPIVGNSLGGIAEEAEDIGAVILGVSARQGGTYHYFQKLEGTGYSLNEYVEI